MRWIGIDLGTSSFGFALYDQNGGGCVSTTILNDADLKGAPWEDTQDAERIFGRMTETLDALLDRNPDVAGIALAGQMHGILYLDARGKALSPLYTWRDGRGNLPLEGDDFSPGESAAEALWRLTGRRCATGFGLVTHFFNLRRRLVPSRTAVCATVADWAAARLAGLSRPMIEASNAASLGLFDVRGRSFDESALSRAGIDLGILPTVAPFGPIGAYRGVPVFNAVGDNQASFAGAVDAKEKTVHLTVGTSAQTTVFSDEFVEIDRLETRPYPGGGCLLVGAALCGGSAWSALRQFFEKTLAAFGGTVPNPETLYAQMEKMAESGVFEGIADSSGVEPPRVTTTLAGTRSEPDARGKIECLSLQNFTPERLAVGFLAGIADELFGFFAALPEALRVERPLLTGSGNGLRRNGPLRRLIERRFDRPLTLSAVENECALGAARLAAEYVPPR